ncbi:MAG: winged helix-turn-helix domain-containing protein [Rubellimicrobium sp.]|nr:winged helix-turn-helix domain-containing protein [Rubellimicrobium sp.]
MEDRNRFPRLRLRIMLAPGQWLGPGKADLLEGIAETGSISAAGRRMGMSYKRAWGLADGMNTMFGAPLVAASRGGADHGGAGLTPLGAEVLALYRKAVTDCEASAADGLSRIGELAALAASDISDQE